MKKLYKELFAYEHKDIYPFHMPGHKRNRNITDPNLPIEYDITEITDFDNLNDPSEIIQDSEERAAALFRTKKTIFSVNGSTAALLSAISSSVDRRGEILIARNCHKAVYNAAYLRELKVTYIYPASNDNMWINGGIVPQDVEKCLKENEKIRAVVLTSPTYDGVVSDIKKIADITHRHGAVLIVDEAHGPHFSFSDYFPESAVGLGADLVIQSFHKTLLSLTQTAALHICSDRVSEKRIRSFMSIYQSSSPSYVLSGSIDYCIDKLERDGRELFDSYTDILDRARKRLEKTKGIRLITPPVDEESAVFDFDRSKLILSAADIGLSGPELHKILHEKYHLEMEMDSEGYVLALSSVGDTEEGFERLCSAVEEIDRQYVREKTEGKRKILFTMRNSKELEIAEAIESKKKTVPLENSIGEIAGEYIYVYPPGIPMIVPGERISKALTEKVREYEAAGLHVIGTGKEQTMDIVDEG